MRIVSKMALAIALGSVAVAAPVFAKKEEKAAPAEKEKATPAVQKAAFDAQKAADAGDVPTALTNYNTAKAAMVNNDDKFMVGRVGYLIFQKNKDQQLFKEAVDLMLDSGKASPAAQKQLYFARGQIAYNTKDYAKAAAAFKSAEEAGADDPDLVPLLVESTALGGQTLPALALLNDEISKRLKAGQPVPTEWYQRGLSIGYKAKPNPAEAPAVSAATLEITKMWVAADPQQRNWHDALMIYDQMFKIDAETRVDLFRLLRAAGALQGDADYREYAVDVYLRFPNEALQVLQEGSGKGMVNLTKGDAADVMGIVKGKVAADKASLASTDKAARASPNARAAVSTADAYVGYGDYAKAMDLYKVALGKSGVDANTVNLRMGWVQALSGDVAGAKTSFAAVTGSKKPLADFWLLHLDHPTVPNKPAA